MSRKKRIQGGSLFHNIQSFISSFTLSGILLDSCYMVGIILQTSSGSHKRTQSQERLRGLALHTEREFIMSYRKKEVRQVPEEGISVAF